MKPGTVILGGLLVPGFLGRFTYVGGSRHGA